MIKLEQHQFIQRKFGLFLDERGVLRCNGRINNAPIPQTAKKPVLLPAKHPLVRLLIQQAHEQVKHNGIRDTLTNLRERYWIIRGREAVKQFIRNCVTCRKFEGAPYKPLPADDLPSTRVSDEPPFSHVGVDFAGPLYVVDQMNEKTSTKVYVCLFTCASTRAVHLEITRGLSAEQFLLAFRRFAARRGLPSTLNSDNAKTFKSTSKDISNIRRSEEVWNYLVNRRISWNFIIEKAPWWGGYWERLVRSVKRPLRKVIGRTNLSFEQLRTLLVEIEGIINARPITYVYDDEESISYALTPSELIYGRRVTTNPNTAVQEILSTYQSLTRRARHHKTLLQQLTKQWRREYLTGLREHSLERARKSKEQNISIGDLVILRDDSTTRCLWKLAIIEELIVGRDGEVRSAVVKVAGNERRPIRLRRVIQHLIPIEVKSKKNVYV